MESVFSYTDYREFLQDFHREHKARNRHFSYRSIARRLGVRSANTWTSIMAGHTKISEKLFPRVLRLLDLPPEEAKYFEVLVRYGQARIPADKRQWLQEMSHYSRNTARKVQPRQYRYYARWCHSAIWALMSYYRFDGDYAKLGKMLYPPISPRDARDSVELLINLGLLEPLRNGRYKLVNPVITNSEEITAHQSFQLATMELAARALDQLPKPQRELATLTLALNEKTFQEAMAHVRECRRTLLELARTTQNPDRVHHFNFQSFPMTRWPEPAPSAQQGPTAPAR